jgi:CBS domain-containing protein
VRLIDVPKTGESAVKIRDVMTTDVATASLDTPYKRLIEMMLERRVSGIPIVDERARLLGIVTEADLVDKQAYGRPPESLLGMLHQLVFGPPTDVAQKAWALTGSGLMTSSVHTAEAGEDVAHVARRLLERNVKRMPVVDEHGVVVGIVSRRDLLAAFARPDDEIAADIERVLASPRSVPDDARVDHVHVLNGLIVLRGTVKHPSDLAVVTGAVRAVTGVIGVESQLHAREPEPQLTGPIGPPVA